MNNEFGNPEDRSNSQDPLKHISNDPELDEAIQRWGSSHSADADHLHRLREQVVKASLEAATHAETNSEASPNGTASMENGLQADTVKPLPENQPTSKTGGWLALVAMVLVALSCWFVFSLQNQNQRLRTELTNQENVVAASLTKQLAANVQQQQELLRQFQEVFGSKFRSVSDVDGKLKIELENDGSILSNQANGYLSVRLLLVARYPENSTSDWQIVKNINVLTGRERRVDVSSHHGTNELSVWAFPVDEGLVSIDLRCQLEAPIKIDVETTELQKSGQSTQIFRSVKDGVEYRLYQTSIRLDGEQSGGLGWVVPESSRGFES